LGSTEVKNADARTKLVDSIVKGMEGKIEDERCFIPGHGLRAKHDGKTVEMVICFQCAKFALYVGNEKPKGFLIGASPQEEFDVILKAAGIPKAK
jgi:hypothetical protein